MITNKIKFLEPNLASYALGARVSSNPLTASANNILSKTANSNWEGVMTPSGNETLTITLSAPARGNRFILRKHNFKDFDLSFGAGVTSMRNIDNEVVSVQNNIFSIRGNTENTSYFYFDTAEVSQIGITVRDTTTANAQRFLFEAILSREIGTFKGYPILDKIPYSMGESRVKSKIGPSYVNKQVRSVRDFSLKFRGYAELDDVRLVSLLFERRLPFLMWPAGGYRKFRFTLDGFRTEDFLHVQTIGDLAQGQSQGSYGGLINTGIKFVESV